MGQPLKLSFHALRRIYSERTVLSSEEIVGILERRDYVSLLVEPQTLVEHMLLYSVKDSDWLVILQNQVTQKIITILPLYMYDRTILQDHLRYAKRLATTQISITLELVPKSGYVRKSTFANIGQLEVDEKIEDLPSWCRSEKGQRALREFISSKFSSKKQCLRVYVRIGKSHKRNPTIELDPP